MIEISIKLYFSETLNEHYYNDYCEISGGVSLDILVHGLYLYACAFSISLTYSAHFHQTSEVMHNTPIINNIKTQSLCFVILTYHKIC